MSATVQTCTKAKDWNKDGKTVPIYKVDLTDGRSGESFGKEIPVGTPESELEITQGQYGNKIKWNQPNRGGGFKAAKGNESFALSYAKDLVIADKVNIKDLLPTADKLYNWLESKKK